MTAFQQNPPAHDPLTTHTSITADTGDAAADLAATFHVLSESAYARLPRPPISPLAGAESVTKPPAPASPNAAPATATTRPESFAERFAPQWSDLLRRAVAEPGLISQAYTRFHGYSLGNRFAALIQCQMRGLEPGPIHTFNGWRKLGYAVKAGERALSLCMPLKGVLAREKATTEAFTPHEPHHAGAPDIEEIEYIRAFLWKPHWFVLAQTQPMNPETVQPLPAPTLAGWNKDQALTTLDIHEQPFTHLDGNVQGYARGRDIAVSPLAAFPYKTLFHEMAHVVLGHTISEGQGAVSSGEPLVDTLSLSRSQIEVEAEGVALLLLDTFDLPGQEYSRGYIQHWLAGEALPEKSAQRIFGGADRILSAGLGEGRVRIPTAEDLGWPEGGAPMNTTVSSATLNGTLNGDLPEPYSPQTLQSDREPTPASAVPSVSTEPVAPSPLKASTRLATPQVEYDRGQEAPAPLTTMTGGRTGVWSDALSVPEGAEHAWKLHERLMLLHRQLHPEDRAQRQSLARAVLYLERLNPESATQVRDLVTEASRSLKAAFIHLEKSLDDPLDNGKGDNQALDNREDDGQAEPPLPATREAATREAAAREAAARRVVGRDLRAELRAAKASFFTTAKEHGLKVGGPHEKAMLAALSQLLEVPIASRRAPTSRQWEQGASAIETEDLRW